MPDLPPKVTQNPDETSSMLMPADDRLSRVTPPDVDAQPQQIINALFAAQIAVHDILAGLVVHVGDYEALISKKPGSTPVRAFSLERITIDHPKSEDEFKPLCAMIMEDADQQFDEEHNVGMVKEDYSEKFSLLRLSHVTCHLLVEAWFVHKEERRAFRTAIQRALLKEPLTERSDRLVVVPQYFGQQCRLTLVRARFPESPEAAQGNRWTLQLSIDATLDELELVPRKARVRVEPRVSTTL